MQKCEQIFNWRVARSGKGEESAVGRERRRDRDMLRRQNLRILWARRVRLSEGVLGWHQGFWTIVHRDELQEGQAWGRKRCGSVFDSKVSVASSSVWEPGLKTEWGGQGIVEIVGGIRPQRWGHGGMTMTRSGKCGSRNWPSHWEEASGSKETREGGDLATEDGRREEGPFQILQTL